MITKLNLSEKEQYRIIEKESYSGIKHYFLQHSFWKNDFFKFSLFSLKYKFHHSELEWDYIVLKDPTKEVKSYSDFTKLAERFDKKLDLNNHIHQAFKSEADAMTLKHKFVAFLTEEREKNRIKNEQEKEAEKNKLIPEKEKIITLL